MALVRIPTPLRNLSSGKDEINIAASNVGDLIEKIEAECPGMKDRLCDESGEIRRFINIYVNNEDIRFLDGKQTALSDGDNVSIIPAIAGGCSLKIV